jgi:hypothetical protein
MRRSTLKPHCTQITESRFIAFLSEVLFIHAGAEPASARNTVAARIRHAGRWRSSIRDVPSVLAAIYGGGGDCSASNPDIAPSSCAMDCTEPSIRSTVYAKPTPTGVTITSPSGPQTVSWRALGC